MKTNCEEVQIQIVRHGPELPLSIRRHVQRCPACRAFERAQALVLSPETEAPAPSAALDAAVLERAGSMLRARRGAGSGRSEVPAGRDLGTMRFPGRAVIAVNSLFRSRRLAVAATLACAAALFALYLGRPRNGGTGQLPLSPAGTGAAVLVWHDAELEQALDELEFELTPAADLAAELAAADPVASTAATGALDEDLFELELDLYMEHERLRSDGMPGGVPESWSTEERGT